jgi:serine phosphatase RsbU (regulator of sigma subunit)
MLYLYTDGFADQFGGPKGKKFKYKKLHETFSLVFELPINEQQTTLENTFLNWKGDLEQVDDVCVLGIRI